jgi:BirA family biotin operon repressor/biotin-[acetyl-CoA-carboxylase] ligase
MIERDFEGHPPTPVAEPQFDRARFEALRLGRGLALGHPLHAVAITGSTNDDALAAARAGAPHGTVFVADSQTRGRGRRGRSWFAEGGKSLLCSVVLRCALPPESACLLSLAAGLAVRAAIAHALRVREVPVGGGSADTGHRSHEYDRTRSPDARAPGDPARATVRPLARASIKWPNDVWLDRKKVAGILAESCFSGAALQAVVIGSGINVASEVFPESLQGVATSLSLAGASVVREELLADYLEALDQRIRTLLHGHTRAIAEELAHHDALLGHEVTVEGVTGVAAGIDAQGRLLVRSVASDVLAISAGTVELIESRERD